MCPASSSFFETPQSLLALNGRDSLAAHLSPTKSCTVFRPVSLLFFCGTIQQTYTLLRSDHTLRLQHVISPKPCCTAYDFSIFSSVNIPLFRSHFSVNSVSDCVYIINPCIFPVNFCKKVRLLAQLYRAFFDRAHSISPFFHQKKM